MTLHPSGMDNLSQRYPGFLSFKTSGSIHYRHRWFRDPLILSALDPLVTDMWASDLAPVLPGVDFTFMTIRATKPTLVVVSTERLTPDDTTLVDTRHINLCRSEFKGPATKAGREIWRHKNHFVSTATRLLAISWMRKTSGSAKLGDLLRALRLPYDDALPAALAMIANGYLSINIAWGLDLDLPIELGPAVSFGESNFDWRSG